MDYRISYTPYTLVKFEYKGYKGIKGKLKEEHDEPIINL